MVKDEQAWRNNYFMKAYCEEVKREVDVRGMPVTLSKTPGEVNTLGPQLGQDTELLMMDLLEYSWDEIETFKASGFRFPTVAPESVYLRLALVTFAKCPAGSSAGRSTIASSAGMC